MFYLDITDILEHIENYKLEERCNTCCQLKGIRCHHCFIHVDKYNFNMKRVSNDSISSSVKLIDNIEI